MSKKPKPKPKSALEIMSERYSDHGTLTFVFSDAGWTRWWMCSHKNGRAYNATGRTPEEAAANALRQIEGKP